MKAKAIARKSVLLGSTCAASLGFATPALADCAPDPAPLGQPIECTGVDADGVVVDSSRVVEVVAGAEVARVTATAKPDPFFPFPIGSNIDLNVAGTVHSVVVENGPNTPFSFFPPSANLNLTVAMGGVIDHQGVQLRANPLAPFGGPNSATATVDNSGLITSDGAFALVSTDSFSTNFTSILNRSTGTIQGIYAPFGTITNRGLIEAKGSHAIVYLAGFQSGGRIDNEGTITGGGSFATIDMRASFPGLSGMMVTNSAGGVIRNLGSGYAIVANSTLAVLNSGVISSETGGAIGSNGDAWVENDGTISGNMALFGSNYAIYVLGGLTLRNKGTINGSVGSAGSGFGFPPVRNSDIQLQTGSRINGNLILGPGNDRLTIDYGEPLANLVTGTIDGGAGENVLRYRFLAGTYDVSAPIATLSGFNLDALLLSSGATVNLRNGFSSTGTLKVALGRFTQDEQVYLNNWSTFATNGTAIFADPFLGRSSELYFTNYGSIEANLASASDFAVVLGEGSRGINEGSIVAHGGKGVLATYNDFINRGIAFINRGSITADGTAADVVNLINSGTITSHQDGGVHTFGYVENSGTISGLTYGVTRAGSVTNSGLISSAGTAIGLRDFTVIENLAGGTITGDLYALAPDPAYSIFYGATARNAGTINGTITGVRDFHALAGGVVNGDLHLGSGTLFVDFGAAGPLGGVNGTIYFDSAATLVRAIRRNTTASFADLLVVPGNFNNNSLALIDNATLVITGPAPLNPSLAVDGAGTIIVDANVTTDGLAPVIVAGAELINRGTITINHTDAAIAPSRFGPLSSEAVINEGTIIVRELAPVSGGPLARGLSGFANFGRTENNGTILVSGGIGIAVDHEFAYSSNAVNNGIIAQLNGGTPGIGMVNFWNATNNGTITTSLRGVDNIGFFTNNGTISSTGPAIRMGFVEGNTNHFGGGTVVNNGLLESSRGPAVRGESNPFLGSWLTNTATGVIRSKANGPAAVFDAEAFIENAGLIDGDVVIGALGDPMMGLSTSNYFSNGGTLKGNLIFGLGDDAVYLRGGRITGYADGGDGNDTVGIDTNGSSIDGFDLRPFRNFEHLFVFGGGTLEARNAPVFRDLSISQAKLIIDSSQTIRATASTHIDGWLQLDGTLKTGVAYLQFNSILSGFGVLDPDALSIAGGYVVPGTDGAIGRLTVKGDVGFDFGGALMIDVGTGDNDRLVVRGDTATTGVLYLSTMFSGAASLNLRAVGTGPRFGRTYTIATAEGGVFGEFGSVQGTFGVLSPVVSYGTNAVTLTFQAASLAAQLPTDATPLERSFALALDSLRANNYANLGTFYGAVDLMDPQGLRLALSSLNPQSAGEAASFYRQQGVQMFDLVAGRMSAIGGGRAASGQLAVMGIPGVAGLVANGSAGSLVNGSQSSLARSFSANTLPGASLPDGMSGFVSGGIDSRSGSLASGDALGATRRSWHMAMGLEMPIGDDLRFGTAIAHSEGLSGSRGLQAEVRTSQLAAYGSLQLSPRAYLGAVAAFGINRIATQRRAWDGASDLGVNARSTALSYSLQAEAGYALPLGGSFALSPRVALRYSGFSIDRLAESGNQAALRLTDLGDNRFEARLGLNFGGDLALGNGWQFSPQAEVEWVRTLSGGQTSALIQFAAVADPGFRFSFEGIERSSIKARAGLTIAKDGLSFTLAGSSEAAWAGQRDERAAVEFRLAF